ncbi:MAG: bifunctional UDP-N-acetylglucosamine diphosphorylase/glucosamine-1-phosphate N-acetyltransferase GlmU [Pseudomonadota bacterium]|nr:bifunctional UDP-N-acetylglucosamine diphosphorylase/glucosamine-1-phosphate N-acetyltransferase GlmU [Pseudomonadota bacterium]
MTTSVIVLAAGKGTRMNSALPKVLQPLGGEPLLAHVLSAARALSPAAIHVVVGHGMDAVRRACDGDDLHWVEQAEQLGTGHAVTQALPYLEAGTALVLYGDVPLVPAETLAALCTAASEGVALLVMTAPDPTGYGRILRQDGGGVLGIVEERDATSAQRRIGEVNTGLMAISVAMLRRYLPAIQPSNAQGEYYLTDVVGLAVAEGVPVQTVSVQHAEDALGVNDKAQLAIVERVLQRRRAEALMRSGVTVVDPARLDVRGELICGRDVFIDVNCVFEGRVILGDGVRIGAQSVVRDCELAAGVDVRPFSHLEGARVGAAARIGPYARLRPGADLAPDTHVGNFVEIKQARVGRGSKINHLSYIGDAEVGCNVNVGAGTITCNYDGVNKHRTVIGDGAFIGSGSQLVAPVTVGEGATVGAGTTLRKDAPPRQLTVGGGRQVTLSHWRRPQSKDRTEG